MRALAENVFRVTSCLRDLPFAKKDRNPRDAQPRCTTSPNPLRMSPRGGRCQAGSFHRFTLVLGNPTHRADRCTANINVSNASSRVIVVDSGGSGTQPYTSAAWLPNNFPLAVSRRDFDVEPFLPPTTPVTTHIGPDRRDRVNPSTIQTRRSFARRRV